jgi:hypothetical protein
MTAFRSSDGTRPKDSTEEQSTVVLSSRQFTSGSSLKKKNFDGGGRARHGYKYITSFLKGTYYLRNAQQGFFLLFALVSQRGILTKDDGP